MTKTVCDRCGKVLADSRNGKMSEEVKGWSKVTFAYSPDQDRFRRGFADYDLCDECKDALIGFIEKKEPNND